MDGSNLTASGQKELQSYLNFFNLKKQEISSEIEMDFSDFFNHQVTETLYNQDDLQGLLSNLRKIIQTSVDKQVAKMVHMSGVYVKIFLSVANDLDFHADFSFIENIQIIEQMKILEKGGSIVDSSSTNQKPVKYQRLATLDTGIQKQLDETTKELEFLRQYNQKLQNELILLKKDVVTDSDQVKQLQAQIESLNKENDNLKLEMDKKLHDSVQFKNLKQMIQEKNQLIKELQQKS